MKCKAIGLPAVTACLLAAASVSRGDWIVFQDNFESGTLDQWIGKSGDPPHGLIVTDPLNPSNQVLTFTQVNFSGDMFSASPINLSLPRHYVLKFDFLGVPDPANPFRGNGGFIGLAAAPTSDSQQFWIGGTYEFALNTPPSVATVLTVDGAWHHYEIDFTEVIQANGLSQALLMLEDWFNFDSVPGDAFFDNVSVVALFDPNTVVSQIPCSGPAPGKKWKNHGAYVSAVSKLADSYLRAGLISQEEFYQITSIAARSGCGS